MQAAAQQNWSDGTARHFIVCFAKQLLDVSTYSAAGYGLDFLLLTHAVFCS